MAENVGSNTLSFLELEGRVYNLLLLNEAGEAQSLDPYSVHFSVSTKEGEALVFAKRSTVAGEIDKLTPQTDEDKKGRATITIKSVDTANQADRALRWDLWLKETATGEKFPITPPGTFEVRPSVGGGFIP